jgi:hypothetical protein
LSRINAKIKKGKVIAPDVSGYSVQYKKLELGIEEFKQQIEESRKRLFWKKDIAVFLEKLTHIAEQLSVDFISIKPSLEPTPIMSKGEDDEKRVIMFKSSVKINLKTGYRELIDFLKRIENSDKFLRIDEINIVVDDKDIFKRDISILLSLFSAD